MKQFDRFFYNFGKFCESDKFEWFNYGLIVAGIICGIMETMR